MEWRSGLCMQTVKHGVKKMTSGTLRNKLARFLFQYRITPQTTTGVSPAELLFGRRLRSRLDALHPNLSLKEFKKSSRNKRQHMIPRQLKGVFKNRIVYMLSIMSGGGEGGGGRMEMVARGHYHLMCG